MIHKIILQDIYNKISNNAKLQTKYLKNIDQLFDLMEYEIRTHIYEIQQEFQVTDLNKLFSESHKELSLLTNIESKTNQIFSSILGHSVVSGKINLGA